MISEPILDTFRQTAGYDGYAAGHPPMIGSRPIKPSDEKSQQKSSSHGRTKSVGIQDFRHLVHTDVDVRPRTAPGAHPIPIDLSDPLRIGQNNGPSQDKTAGAPHSIQAPPKVPNLQTSLAIRGGPKYFDLLQAAVSSSKGKARANSTQTSFDLYNESIAVRNSMYGNPPKLSAHKDAARASLAHVDDNAISAHSMDKQRASFDAMRASRNARTSTSRRASKAFGPDMPGPSATDIKVAAAEPLSGDARRQDLQPSGKHSIHDIVLPQIPSEARRSKRKSIRHVDLPSPLSPIPQEKSSPVVPSAGPNAAADGINLLPNRRRSKTASTAPSLGGASEASHIGNNPAILTLHPFAEELNQSGGAGGMLNATVPSTISNSHGDAASTDQIYASQHPDIISSRVPPRTSSDRSFRKREKDKRHSRELVMIASDVNSGEVHISKHTRRETTTPARTVLDLTMDESGRKSDGEEHVDNDVKIEQATTRQAHLVQTLRASVVSPDSYVFKGGDNVILGKVLHHRPSRPLSQVADVNVQSDTDNVKSGTGSKGLNDTPASVEAPSLTSTITSDSALQRQVGLTERRRTTSEPVQHASNIIDAPASLKVPPRSPAEAKTRSPKSGYTPSSPLYEPNSQHVMSETSQPQILASDTMDDVTSYSRPSVNSSTVGQHDDAPPHSNGSRRIMPASAAILSRDFAPQEAASRIHPSEAIGRFQSRMVVNGIGDVIDQRNTSSTLGGYIHISQQELDLQGFDLDRSIAIKKEAAAVALLKLHQVMAMPAWEKPSHVGRRGSSTRVPIHGRGSSVDDGGPKAPTSIFRKVNIPIGTPPLSSSSTFTRQDKQDVPQSPERGTNTATKLPVPPSALAIMSNSEPSKAHEDHFIATVATSEPTNCPRPEGRGRSETTGPRSKGSHSRMGSTASATSRTSAHSLPHHMVPARSSSKRGSGSSVGDFGDPSRFHVGDLGWQ